MGTEVVIYSQFGIIFTPPRMRGIGRRERLVTMRYAQGHFARRPIPRMRDG